MFIVRPFTSLDEQTFIQFAFVATFGMTSLPRDKHLLHEKISHTVDTFSNRPLETWEQIYLFALEDLNHGILAGISAIIPHTGQRHAEYYYRLHTNYTHATQAHIPTDFQLLKAISYAQGPTEIASLYLNANYRKGGLGRLLSLSRFLYISNCPNAFEDVIIARLRGVLSSNEGSPFWDSLGYHFYQVSLQEVIYQVSIDKSFIPQIVPQHPIYTMFLSQEAQKVIGQPDVLSKPAHAMLINEGFSFTHDLDIIDGGPKLACPRSQVRTIQQSTLTEIGEIVGELEKTEDFLISNTLTDLRFRACCAPMILQSSGKAMISSEVANALLIKKGDKIRYVTRGKVL